VVAAVLLAVVAVYVVAAVWLGDRVPRGTTVSGVAVGGQGAGEATDTLDAALGAGANRLGIAAGAGLRRKESKRLVGALGREPSLTELGIFSGMWSEHCSYKSSKVWLKKLPTEGPQVIQGPGENAGVVDLGDGQAAVFKMESHNHPSYIEPYQGAATGVGGIMRDVFTMGARPVANMNALRFGAPEHPKTRHLVAGVVSGIGDYGSTRLPLCEAHVCYGSFCDMRTRRANVCKGL